MKNAALTAIACAIAVAVQAGVLTPEQALDRRSLGEPQFSPDGSRVVFTVSDPPKGTTAARAIWLVDVADRRPRQLTFSGKNDTSPRWSPDGRSIAFLSNRDGAAQLYVLPMTGGEAAKLTEQKESILAFRWSPDGRRLAFLMNQPRGEADARRQRDKDDARVVDKESRRPRLWTVDVATRDVHQVTVGSWRIDEFEWLPAGDSLVAIATSKPAADAWTERLYRIHLDNGDFTEIAAPRGPIGELAVSPDGTTIAFAGARVDGPDAHDVYIVPVSGGTPRNVTAASLDRPIAQLRWIDHRSLAAIVARGFGSSIATIGLDGRVADVAGLDVNPGSFARAGNGTIAFVGETTVRAPELWIKTAGSPAHAVTRVNEQWATIPVTAPEFFKYKSYDGTNIEAALLKPSTLNPSPSAPQSSVSRPVPLVVLVHGGPTGRWVDRFEPWGQLLASRGYAVVYPNVRGSTGYGARFVEMNRADWGGGDYKDVMAAVDALIARGVADPNRLGIGGWSYGGYMAAWAVTQTNRFKAAVSGAPVIDMASEFGTENGPAYDEWFYGTPYEKLDGFIRSSPITYVKNVKTPTLLLQGEDDTTDPIGQSQQFYRGLKRYGVDAELVLYPREPHGLREEKHLLDRLTRILAWYDKHLTAPRS